MALVPQSRVFIVALASSASIALLLAACATQPVPLTPESTPTLASARALRASTSPAASDLQEFSFANTTSLGSVSVEGQPRVLYNNAAGHIRGFYEPALLPYSVQVVDRRICLDILLDSNAYRAHMQEILGAQNTPTPIQRLPISNLLITLGPNDDLEPAYGWLAPRWVQAPDTSNTLHTCFQPPLTFTDEAIAKLTTSSSLRAWFTVRTAQVQSQTCSIRLRTTNEAIFAGGVRGSGSSSDDTVYLTRNQLADALTNSWISVTEDCVHGGTTDSVLASATRVRELLSTIISSVGLTNIPWQEAIKGIANFSFNGENAGSRLNNYTKTLSDRVKQSNNKDIDVSQEAEAKVLGIGGSGKLRAQYVTASTQDEQHDFHFNWVGEQIRPASLDVMVLKKGQGLNDVELRVTDTAVLGSSEARKSYAVPFRRSGTPLSNGPATVTVQRDFPMRAPIAATLTGYKNCTLLSASGSWSAYGEGSNWRQCSEYPIPDVKNNVITSDFDVGHYQDNRGDCSYFFSCERDSAVTR